MRILLGTVTAGAGHLQAAIAVEEAWQSLRPADTVERLDLLELVPRLQRQVYVRGYLKLIEHAPELWGLLFQKTDNPALLRRISRLRRAWAKATNLRFTRRLRRFRPDAVICTHFLPTEVLGALRRDGDARFVVNVVTDFEAHALWIEPAVDLYCVATEDTRESLAARGVPADRIVATGIPIAARFGALPDAGTVRRQFGLREDLPVLLVLGGGFGMGPVAEILGALDQVPGPVQILVVAGRNAELRARLATLDVRHPTRVLGFVTNMHELMTAADLVVTKPGGLTTAEALAVGRPLFILNPIPGQEAANSDFLLANGAAAKASRLEDLPFRVGQLLGSAKIREMAKAAARLGRPDAARRVCEETLQRLTPGERS